MGGAHLARTAVEFAEGSLPTLLTVAVVLVTVVVVVRFELLCLTDLARADDRQLRYLSRAGWFLMCLVLIPFGGILYLLFGRVR